ncbi:MAG: hypothetical protein E7012_01590 [Alphaproteobacteria bacterium]|nr:hypothetical protein [Alphaproteobacteria bacterium]
MKPLLIITRIILVGIFWSILFLEGIRVIMLTNWHFDMFRVSHWLYAWNLWLSGWIIDDPKEWAFILIIITFIPVWLTGWTALSMINWSKIFNEIIRVPLSFIQKILEKPVKKITSTASVKAVKKKKSYKEIRPRSIRPPMEESTYNLPSEKRAALSGTPLKTQKQSLAPVQASTKPSAPAEFNHSLFKFDDDEDNGFDFDLFEEPQKTEATPKESPKKEVKPENNKEKNQPRTNKNDTGSRNNNSTLDALKQKGYDVITGISIKNTPIDFIGVSKTQLCICLNDKEPGDWLADEERFNDEEPLWFSESSHRISPVRKIDIARNIIKDKLSSTGFSALEIDAFVIEQIGNIINAEDMFEIWGDMKIKVTRIDRGTPKELKLFNKALDDADGRMDKDSFEKLKKTLRSIT